MPVSCLGTRQDDGSALNPSLVTLGGSLVQHAPAAAPVEWSAERPPERPALWPSEWPAQPQWMPSGFASPEKMLSRTASAKSTSGTEVRSDQACSAATARGRPECTRP